MFSGWARQFEDQAQGERRSLLGPGGLRGGCICAPRSDILAIPSAHCETARGGYRPHLAVNLAGPPVGALEPRGISTA